MDNVNYHDATSEHIKLSLRRFKVSLDTLGHKIDSGTANQLGDSYDALLGVVLELLAAFERDQRWDGKDYGRGPCPAVAEHGQLELFTTDALKGSPQLQAWQRVGNAVGRCSLSTLSEDNGLDVDFRPLCQAVNALSPRTLETCSFLFRCARLHNSDSASDPVKTLDTLLGTSPRYKSVYGDPPKTRILSQLILLDVEFLKTIQNLTEPQATRLQLDASDQNKCQATLDGNTYQVTYQQLLLLQSLIDAGGDFVVGKDITAEHSPKLDGVRLDRLRGKLPDPIKAYIQSESGKGYRLVLPPFGQ